MKTLKEPMASPEFANLLPEVKEFYKSQVAGIEKQVADIEKSKQ
jgi:hypothetical protein